MKFRNFTGQIPNFCGGFSGGSPTESRGTLWQLGTYNFRGSLSIGTETAPLGIWFKTDGTKLYVVGETRDRIRSWDLTTAWDITTATNLFDMPTTLLDNLGVAITAPSGLSFSNDGLFVFVCDRVNSALYRYNLGTAWDLSTLNATASQVNTSIYTGALNPGSIWVRPDGLFFTTCNQGATASVRNFTSSVANDITTLTLATSVTNANIPVGGVWVDDGNKFLLTQQSNDLLLLNNVTSAYAFPMPSTISSRVVTVQDTTPQDCYMKNDGSAFYYLGSASDTIYQFTL